MNQIIKKDASKLAGQTAALPAGDLPPEYVRLTANAERLSVNFRFRTGSSQLDNKAVDDLDRVTAYLASPVYRRGRPNNCLCRTIVYHTIIVPSPGGTSQENEIEQKLFVKLSDACPDRPCTNGPSQMQTSIE